MNASREGALSDLQLNAREQLRAAVVSEQRLSWIAAVVPIGLWLWVLRAPILLLFAVVIAALGVLRGRALPAIERGEIERAVLYFMIGKWLVSIALAFILPIALPIVVVNLIMPIALASTNLEGRRFVPMIVGAVLVAFVAGAIGYTTNVVALDEEVTPWVWQWLCIIILAFHFIPLSLILWRTNQQQALTLDEAFTANTQLLQSEHELRTSRRRLVEAADIERSRIEQDLHDGAQQRLVSVLMQLRVVERQAERGNAVEPAAINSIAEELEASIGELRDLAHGIYPPLLESGGLGRALAAVARRTGSHVTVHAHQAPRATREVEAAAYFCCLEAIQNAEKHGTSDVAIRIDVRGTERELTVQVSDDGPGFETARRTGGQGIQNMSDRVRAAGGTLNINSTPGRGTSVDFEFPLTSNADDSTGVLASSIEPRS